MRKLNHLLSKSAREWNVSIRFAVVLVLTPFIGAVLLAATRLHYSTFRFLTAEDGPIEWLAFGSFALACAFGLRITLIQWKLQQRRIAILYALFAFAMLFAAGEEISWGQRLFDIETPELLEEINKQDEITLHNIGDALKVLNLIQLGIGAAGASLYLINEFADLSRLLKTPSFLFTPPFFLSSWFLIVFGFRFVRIFFWRDSGFTITKFGEWTEMCLAVGLVLFAGLVVRRLADVTTPASSPLVTPIRGTGKSPHPDHV